MAWQNINEYVLLKIYELLSTKDIDNAGRVCRRWWTISKDELLWRKIVLSNIYKSLKYSPGNVFQEVVLSPAPGISSWTRFCKMSHFKSKQDQPSPSNSNWFDSILQWLWTEKGFNDSHLLNTKIKRYYWKYILY